MSFVSLALIMVYLGGMLVVFVYSVSLAADPYPEGWGDWGVVWYGLVMGLVVMVGGTIGEVFGVLVDVGTVDNGGLSLVRLDFSGVAVLYS